MTSYVSSLVRKLQTPATFDNNTNASSAKRPFADASGASPRGLSNAPTRRYIGPNACLNTGALSSDLVPVGPSSYPQSAKAPALPTEHEFVITTEIHRFLLGTYLYNIHCLYPFLDNTSPPLTLVTQSLTTQEPWQEFMLQMIYAVACFCVDKEGYRSLAADCHRRAMKYIDRATAHTNVESLQAVIILAVHGLFQPKHGNVSQLIGFATRLMMDIERYCQNQGTSMHGIYTTLYCLENQCATVLDRPTLLPERPEQGQGNRMDVKAEVSPFSAIHQVEGAPSDALFRDSLVYFLYQTQNRFRKGDPTSPSLLYQRLSIMEPSWSYIENSLHPNIRAVVYETYFLIDANPATACRLLGVYALDSYISNCLTSHWTYKAAKTIFGRRGLISNVEFAKGCSDCILVLDGCSRTWSGSWLLKQAVVSYLENLNRLR